MPGAFQGMRHHRGGRHMHAIGQRQVPQHDGAAAQRAVRTDGGTAGHADTTGHGAVAPHAHVVADLHQVVEFHAVLDHRVLQRAAVNAGVGSDLDIVADAHRAQLLDLDPGAAFRRKAEAVGANHGTGMHGAALAHMAVLAHRHVRHQHRAGAHVRAALDHAQRADRRRRVHHGRGVHHRAGMHTRRTRRAMQPLPQLRGAGKVQVRVVRHDAGTAGAGHFQHRRRHNDAGRPGGGQLLLVARVAEKAQVLGSRCVQRGQPLNALLGVSLQRAAQRTNQLRKTQAHAAPARSAPE